MASLQRIARRVGNWLLPFRILSTASSFEDGGVWTLKSLNRLGLHRWRVKTAARMTRRRRAKLEAGVPSEWREDFQRDGFVIIRNALPEKDFEAIRAGLLKHKWPSRHMMQGNTITRRVAVDDDMLEKVPELDALFRTGPISNLLRYVASFDSEPLHYIQAIIRKKKGPDDPQVNAHADTFHSSMKAWLFLEDVDARQGAFSYVPGSHKLTPDRLDFEHRTACSIDEETDRLTRRGSFRISPAELGRLKLPKPRAIACSANTLVVADTFGFHARGPSRADLHRIEIWSYLRRNPFLPWTGGDIWKWTGLSTQRVSMLWSIRDRLPGLLKQPWKDVGNRYLDAGTSRKHSRPGKKGSKRRRKNAKA